uniref:Uncharacterized protein n=1 Tax=Knipowitschia caucasica TaxID=637954 RepID=A0AAV2ITN3_KNICA
MGRSGGRGVVLQPQPSCQSSAEILPSFPVSSTISSILSRLQSAESSNRDRCNSDYSQKQNECFTISAGAFCSLWTVTTYWKKETANNSPGWK